MGSAANMRRVARIIESQGAALTVLSAMSGTTDALAAMAGRARAGAGIDDIAGALRAKYAACIEELLGPGRGEAQSILESTLTLLAAEAASFRGEPSERLMMAQGELLTSAIFTIYMNESGRRAVLLNAPGFVRTDAEGKVDTEQLRLGLGALMEEPGVHYITQGFVCTDSAGALSNLGRGGSDYSAALMGAAAGAGEVQIWTDIDGMHNNDPRCVEGTAPIRSMSFDEAEELAYFGAKILHPSTIQPCRDMNIPVLLKNTMDPAAEGTRISGDGEAPHDFHAIAAKDGIAVVRIHSARMLMAYGFLRRVFEVFEEFRTPIDMITTSEVAVSLTVDNDRSLAPIAERLRAFGSIEIERDNSIVCIAGDFGHERSGMAARVFGALGGIPVKMISYGASRRSLALLVDTQHKVAALQALHGALFSGCGAL